jgi:hypothetical protein
MRYHPHAVCRSISKYMFGKETEGMHATHGCWEAPVYVKHFVLQHKGGEKSRVAMYSNELGSSS